MEKIKIFSDSSLPRLETYINDWLKHEHKIKVQQIFQSHFGGENDLTHIITILFSEIAPRPTKILSQEGEKDYEDEG